MRGGVIGGGVVGTFAVGGGTIGAAGTTTGAETTCGAGETGCAAGEGAGRTATGMTGGVAGADLTGDGTDEAER